MSGFRRPDNDSPSMGSYGDFQHYNELIPYCPRCESGLVVSTIKGRCFCTHCELTADVIDWNDLHEKFSQSNSLCCPICESNHCACDNIEHDTTCKEDLKLLITDAIHSLAGDIQEKSKEINKLILKLESL